MTIGLVHAFVSAKADGGDATLIQPSNWNDEHTLTMATGYLVGRTTASAGAAEEISVTSPLSLSGGALSLPTLLVQINAAGSAANKLAYYSGTDTVSLADLTAAARTALGLADPDADRVLFWDDSASSYAFLTVSTGLDLTGATLTATGAASGDVTASGLTMATDRLLGRDTASTGAIEELTIGAGLSLSGGELSATGLASTTQTAEMMAGFIAAPSDKSYTIVVKMAHAGTITETTTVSASGTCTATFKVNATALGGTANSVSSTEQSQAHASSNTFVAGDDIALTVSSNASCADMSFSIKYTRTLA